MGIGFADCWKFNTHSPKTKVGLGSREGVFAFAIKNEHRVFVVGGCGSGNQDTNCGSTLQSLDLVTNTWQPVPISIDSNPQRVVSVGAAYTYNRFSHRVYEFGGTRSSASGSEITNTFAITYEDQSSGRWIWKIPTVSGNPPSPAQDASATTFGVSVVVFGGYDESNFFNTVYYINSSGPNAFAWSTPSISGSALAPSPRCGVSATRWRSTIIYFGGTNGKASFNDLHILTVPANRYSHEWAWSLVTPVDTRFAPSARAYHSASLIASSAGDRLVIFGGFDPTHTDQPVYFNDVFVLDLTTMTWLQPPPSLSQGVVPLARKKHAALAMTNAVLFFGGCAHKLCYSLEKVLVLDIDAVCPNSCKQKGRFHFNETDQQASCICEPQFEGKFCEKPVSCPNDCSKRGTCKAGVCDCKLGYGGADCSELVCPNDCSSRTGRGVCSHA